MQVLPLSRAPLSILGKKIAFSTLVQYAGKFVQLILSAIILKQISNYLSEHSYATYGAVMEFALFFSTAANLGIFANVVRKMAQEPLNGRTFFNALILRLVTCVILFAGAVIYLFSFVQDSVFIWASLIFLIALLFDYVTSVCDGVLQANYLMGRATFALMLGKLVTATGTFLVIFYNGKLSEVGAAGGLSVNTSLLLFFGMVVLGSLITMGLSFLFVAKKFAAEKVGIFYKVDWLNLWKILKTSLPYGVIITLNALYFRFLPDYFSHQALTGPQFAAFNVSFRVAQVISLISTFLMFSALPGLKQYLAKKELDKARILYKKIFWLMLVGGAMVFVFGSLLGPWAIQILTHKKYFLPEFWFLLPAMLFLAAISYFYDLVTVTLFAFEKDLWLMKLEFLAIGVALIFFLGSYLINDLNGKLFFILAGAIIAETIVVIIGSLKVRNLLLKPGHNASFIEEDFEPVRI